MVYADDEAFNRAAMKAKFQEKGVESRLIMFPDGDETVKYFKSVVEVNQSISTLVFQPVSVLILDINMPVVNGLQAAEQVKALY